MAEGKTGRARTWRLSANAQRHRLGNTGWHERTVVEIRVDGSLDEALEGAADFAEQVAALVAEGFDEPGHLTGRAFLRTEVGPYQNTWHQVLAVELGPENADGGWVDELEAFCEDAEKLARGPLPDPPPEAAD